MTRRCHVLQRKWTINSVSSVFGTLLVLILIFSSSFVSSIQRRSRELFTVKNSEPAPIAVCLHALIVFHLRARHAGLSTEFRCLHKDKDDEGRICWSKEKWSAHLCARKSSVINGTHMYIVSFFFLHALCVFVEYICHQALLVGFTHFCKYLIIYIFLLFHTYLSVLWRNLGKLNSLRQNAN
jgi:hypothetical protein